MKSTNVNMGDGGFVRVEKGGRGFLIVPGGSAPGGYPLTVTPTGVAPITVNGPDGFYLPAGKTFTALEIQQAIVGVQTALGVSSAPTGSTYTVYTFEDETDFIDRATAQGSIAFQALNLGSLLATDPTDADTTSLDIQSNFSALTFYFSGVAQDVTLWVRSLGGAWFVSEVLSLAAGAMTFTRAVYVRGGRIALRAAADTTAVRIDANVEL